jgi:putative FmdB family regulatory protein
MPIYEYQCDKCEHVLEALQKIAEEPLRYCPECGADALKRLLSAPRFRLKGSGWYETDFKKDGDKRRNLAGEGSTATSSGSSTSGSSSSSSGGTGES